MENRRHRVLMFCEGATLAHVTRPLSLLAWLPPSNYDVDIACSEQFTWALGEHREKYVPLYCQPSEEFGRRLARGVPLYDLETLKKYVDDDLKIISRACPDVIIGDFRISLSVSARLAGVPYIGISDAYWSLSELGDPPLPVLPGTRILPLPLYSAGFRLLAPLVMHMHTLPMKRLRRQFGVEPGGSSLSEVYQDSDCTLYANIPMMFPRLKEKEPQKFVGPLNWALPGRLPEWWDALPPREKCVFVCLGSSGAIKQLNTLVDAVIRCDRTAIVATAGRSTIPHQPDRNVFVADYLPGAAACAHASVVISNGGSPMSQLALSRGTPVLGVPSNMDQFLCMRYLSGAKLGFELRADRCSKATATEQLEKIIESQDVISAAGAIPQTLADEKFAENLMLAIESVRKPFSPEHVNN